METVDFPTLPPKSLQEREWDRHKSKETEKYIRFENSSHQRILCVVAVTWNLEQEEEKTADF